MRVAIFLALLLIQAPSASDPPARPTMSPSDALLLQTLGAMFVSADQECARSDSYKRALAQRDVVRQHLERSYPGYTLAATTLDVVPKKAHAEKTP